MILSILQHKLVSPLIILILLVRNLSIKLEKKTFYTESTILYIKKKQQN